MSIKVRYIYAATVFVERHIPVHIVKTQTLAFLAADDDEARNFTLAYAYHFWPKTNDWRHEASILRVSDTLISGHGMSTIEPRWEVADDDE